MKFYLNSPIAVLRMDSSLSTIVSANLSFLKMFEFASNEHLTGRKLSDIKVFNDSGIKQIKDKLVREGLLFDEKMFCFTKSGQMITCLVSMQEDNDGDENFKTFFFHNITALHNLEVELEKSKQLAENALSMQALFLANVSHEIRTPINGILGFTELLQKTKLSNEQSDYLHSIDVSGKTLLKIVADILDATKIEAGLVNLEQIPFSIKEKLEELIKLFEPQVSQKQLHFLTHLAVDLPESVYGDPLRMTQIVNNLVSNAIKFTPNGGTVQLKAEVAQINEQNVVLKLSVIDSGIGIDNDKLDKIFEKFIQADNTTTRKFGGTGLGLSIVKKLVELHKGSIHVKSERNKGTNFYCFLPYSLMNNSIKPNEVLKNTSQTNLIKNKKILLVEDNEINQKLTSTILGQEGAVVTIANHGEIALQLLEHVKYDIILMDIQMPVLDGITTTIKIRKELHLDTPIIAMTANVIPGERKVCLNSGMNEYISKPFNSNDLIQLINRQLANRTNQPLSNVVNDSAEINPNKQDLLNIISKGNNIFKIEMIELFLDQCPVDIEKLKVLVKNKDFQGIRAVTHRLQTSFGIMGFDNNTLNLLKEVEQLAKDEREFEIIKASIVKIIERCSAMQINLSHQLKQLKQIS